MWTPLDRSMTSDLISPSDLASHLDSNERSGKGFDTARFCFLLIVQPRLSYDVDKMYIARLYFVCIGSRSALCRICPDDYMWVSYTPVSVSGSFVVRIVLYNFVF